MKLLLDTCTFLWIVRGSREVSATALKLFEAPENEVFLSTVSAWEIAVKNVLGHLPLPEALEIWLPKWREQHGITSLALDEETALHVARLPMYHRDPFDRMLVSQALVHGLVLLTPDPLIAKYPARTAW